VNVLASTKTRQPAKHGDPHVAQLLPLACARSPVLMPGRTKRAPAATHSTHNAEGARASPHAEPTDDHPARGESLVPSAHPNLRSPQNHYHRPSRHDEPIHRSNKTSKVHPAGVQLRRVDSKMIHPFHPIRHRFINSKKTTNCSISEHLPPIYPIYSFFVLIRK
jgi:hypothetical protein